MEIDLKDKENNKEIDEKGQSDSETSSGYEDDAEDEEDGDGDDNDSSDNSHQEDAGNADKEEKNSGMTSNHFNSGSTGCLITKDDFVFVYLSSLFCFRID